MNPSTSATTFATAILLAVATWHDCRRFRIPNAATYVAIGFGLLAAAMNLALQSRHFDLAPPLSHIGLSQALLGGLIGFALVWPLYYFNGRGAGDVKLAAALGVLLGPLDILNAVIWTFLCAGVYASLTTIALGCHLRLAHADNAGAADSVALDRTARIRRILSRPVPLAGFFALGTLIVWGGL